MSVVPSSISEHYPHRRDECWPRREPWCGPAARSTAEAVETAAAQHKRAQANLEQSRRNAADLRAEHERLTKLVGSWDYWEQYRVRRDEIKQAEADGPRLPSDQLDRNRRRRATG